tara:strand:+ start:172 stop:942 length:771 start_codon:yes stop_codon:yes gene_type:complete
MKKTKPKVSIIISYYKKKFFFRNTINSILKQTYKNYEIIVIYDDDNKIELDWVKKVLEKVPRFKIIINKKNIGAGLSRNKGIDYAKGKYIAFCDADDLWHKNKLKTQIDYMQKKKINFCHTSYTVINYYGKVIGNFCVVDKLNYNSLLKSCDIATSSVIVSKNVLKGKNLFANFKTKEDYSLWLKIVKKEKELYGININLVFWRSIKNSLSSSFFQKLIDAFKIYKISENYNTLQSIYLVIRLTMFALLKKIDMYR